MKYKELKGEFKTNVDFKNPTYLLIKSLKELDNSKLILEEQINDESYFNDHNILLVVFFDGSLPKRFIKRLEFDDLTKKMTIISNKSELTFSTMDYRMHVFVFEIEKFEINEYKLI